MLFSSRAGLLDVVPDARRARLPRQRVLALRVVVDRLEVVDEVRDVRDVLLVDRLDVVVADPARGHVVGQRHDVAADRLMGLQLLADLPVELEVVVDLLGVLDLAAVLLVELLEDLLVDVERPVGEGPVADRGLRVVDGRGGRLVLGGLLGLALHAAARGEHGGQPAQREAGAPGPADEASPRQALAFEELLEGSLDARVTHGSAPWRRRRCGGDSRSGRPRARRRTTPAPSRRGSGRRRSAPRPPAP